MELKLENVWQAKELQARFMDVWQGKDLAAQNSDVWQGKNLAKNWSEIARTDAVKNRKRTCGLFFGLLGELGEADLQARFLDVWQGKELRDFAWRPRVWLNAGRLADGGAFTTKQS